VTWYNPSLDELSSCQIDPFDGGHLQGVSLDDLSQARVASANLESP
jgi:hypothetical protein